ncbi:MAG: TRCF domain-containing protein [Pyrinomonadaceae bacterium]
MLERTVAELRGEDVADEASVSLNLGVDVSIPEDYIADMGQRLRVYKRISSARDEETMAAVRAETEDRFGRPPESVERLFAYARLRRTAEDLGVISIDRTPSGIAIKLSEKARVSPESLLGLVKDRQGATFTPNGVLKLPLTEQETEDILGAAHEMLLGITRAE